MMNEDTESLMDNNVINKSYMVGKRLRIIFVIITLIVTLTVTISVVVVTTTGSDSEQNSGGGGSNPTPWPTSFVTGYPSVSPTPAPTSPCRYGVKPNVVIILADDQGFGDRQRYNSDILDMPNIEKLAAGGVDFNDGHSESGVCSPSRYSLLTGEYYFRANSRGNALGATATPLITETKYTIPRMLKDAGYKSYMSGKWHIGMDMPDNLETGEIYGGPIDAGFDRFFGVPASFNYGHLSYIHNKTFSKVPSHRTTKSSHGSTGIRSCPSGKSDCTTFGFTTCTEADCSPMGWYGGSGKSGWGITIAPDFDLHRVMRNFTHAALGFIDDHIYNYGLTTPFYVHITLNSPHLPHVPHPDFQDKNKRGYGAYADFLEETDYRVGEVVSKLEEHGVLNNTLIIYTSDNGPEGASKYIKTGLKSTGDFNGQKRTLKEGGNRVPFIAHWPEGIPQGKQFDHYVSQTDILATLADITGVTIPSSGAPDSFSFWKAMCDPEASGPTDIRQKQPMINEVPLSNNNGKIAQSIRCGHFKLYNEKGSWKLYNITSDPTESTNLYKKEKKISSELETMLYHIVQNSPKRHDTTTAICDKFLI